VEVVEDDEQGLNPGGVGQKGGEAVEEPEARLCRLQRRWLGQVWEQLAQLLDELGDAGRPGAQFRP